MTTEEATTLMRTARQHLVKDEFEPAITGLATALDMLTTTYGPLAPETAECYYLYGRALTLNISASNSLLAGGGADDENGEEGGEGGDEDEDGDGDGEGDEIDGDNGAEGSATAPPPQQAAPPQPSSSAEAKTDTGASTTSDTGVADDNVDDAQLAWEVLETARIIYSKMDSVQAHEYLSKIHGTMADLSMENGTFDVAVSEYKQCLCEQQAILPPLSRLLGETHFKLALAYELKPEMDKAMEHLQAAISLLESRVQWLQTAPPIDTSLLEDTKGKGRLIVENAGSASGIIESVPSGAEAKAEVDEINDLLVSLHHKREDYELEMRKENELNEARKKMIREMLAPALSDAMVALGQQLQGGGSSSSASAAGSSSSTAAPLQTTHTTPASSEQPVTNAFGAPVLSSAQPVNDISSMVRKRKAPGVDAPPSTSGTGDKGDTSK